jgi:hypothetical protein
MSYSIYSILKTNLLRCFWLACLMLLAACSPNLPSATPVSALTAALQSTATITPTILAETTRLPTVEPSPSVTPEPAEVFVKVPGLRVAYIVDGNLYVQDSGGKPLQLTHGGADSEPSISADGQKLVFLRSKSPANHQNGMPLDLYSINADGSGERVLVTYEKLKAIDAQYAKWPAQARSSFFISGTHFVLFETGAPPYVEGGDNMDLFWVDTDNARIHRLAAIDEGWYRGGSQNGQLLAFQRIIGGQRTGQLDLIGLNGKVIRPDIFGAMFPDEPSRFLQNYLSAFWVSDGSHLLAVPGDPMDLPMVGRTIWQYSMADGSVSRIAFDPSPVTNMFDISSDGNWVVYTYRTTDDSDEARFGVYLGSLRTGVTRKLPNFDSYYGPEDEYIWSPDNTHFYFSGGTAGFIGDINGNIEPSCNVSYFNFKGWIDDHRYMCGLGGIGVLGKTGLEWAIESPAGYPKSIHSNFDFALIPN